MVRLTTITTKTGDDGTTGLADGSRRPKYDLRIHAIGSVDEANATLGLCRAQTTGEAEQLIARIQNDLFDLGADLATPQNKETALRINPAQVIWLEETQADLLARLQPLTSFILPGGTPASALLHLARTTVRRAERTVSELHSHEPLNPYLLQYLNRLSDFLFVLGRILNNNGQTDLLWQPAAGQMNKA